MKLKNVCIILVAIFMVFTISANVLAYSTDTYSVEINEEEYEKSTEEGMTLFQKIATGDNIVIQEIKQKTFGGKLTQYQLNTISQEIVDQYQKEYNSTIIETSREELKINDYTVTKMCFEADIYGYKVQQELNIFVSSDRLYDIIFTTVTENGFTEEEKNNILNSFKILNNEVVEDNSSNEITNNSAVVSESSEEELTSKDIIITVIVLALILVVVFLVISNSKNKTKAEKINDEQQDSIIEVKEDNKEE